MTNLELKKPFSLHVLVQNLGQGIAKNIEVKLNIPENTYLTGGDAYLQINQLAPGEKRNIEYEMILNSKYKISTNIKPTHVKISIEHDMRELFLKYTEYRCPLSNIVEIVV